MEYRYLGRSGLKVSAYGFGAMTFGDPKKPANVGETTGDEARRHVDMCLDAGVTLFDTANIYAMGQSEEILGEALGSRRQKVVIATKFIGKVGPGPNDEGASRSHIIEACEASLKRLKTDYIDLYQIHNQDLMTPVEETLRAYDDLIRAGKVRYVGSSNHAGWVKMRALATADRLGLPRYISQQIQYSLVNRDAEAELLSLGVHEGVGALIWSPLASGYLSGKYRDGAPESATRLVERGSLDGRDTEQARKVVDLLFEIAAGHEGASPSQVALNWIIRKAGVTSILIGARKTDQLADNLKAAEWSLSDEEIARLDEVSAVPARYPYAMHQMFMAERNPAAPLLPPLNAH